jgi:hypothetical protein
MLTNPTFANTFLPFMSLYRLYKILYKHLH